MINYNEILILILAFTRISAFIFTTPMLSGKDIPLITKIVISVSIAYAALQFFHLNGQYDTWTFIGALITQFLIGFTLGMMITFMVASVQVAGGILDLDLGLSASSVVNPDTNQQTTLMSNFYYFLYVLVFISVGGIRDLIASVVYSFQFESTASFLIHQNFIKEMLAIVIYMMTAAVQVALPLMITMFIVNFILLIIGKTSQTINIMGIAFGVKILIGFVVVILILPYMGNLFSQMEIVMMDKMLIVIKTMLA